jgi:hypothetical protein
MRTFSLAAAAVVLTLAGCAAPPSRTPPPRPSEADAFGAPTALSARLAEAVTIELRWKDDAAQEAGYVVEGYFVSPGATREFVRIDTVPADTTVYRHEKLMPHTTFVYRVRAFFGRASNEARIVTGSAGAAQLTVPETPRPAAATPTALQKSLRSRASAAEAAPRDLRATLLPPAGVRLEWKDYARDEEEYFLEIQTDDAPFRPSVSLAPDATSLVSYDFPFDARVAFRVRAVAYSEPSNVVERTTEGDPDDNRLRTPRPRPSPFSH